MNRLIALGGIVRRKEDGTHEVLAADPGEAAGSDEIKDEEWRPVTLAQLGVKGKLRDTLEAVGIRNHGDLADAFRTHKIDGIAGIGDGSKSKLNDLMADWWDRRRAATPKPKLQPGRQSLVGPGTDNPPTPEQAAASVCLVWKADPEDPACFLAENTAGLKDDADLPFEFYVGPDETGRFTPLASCGALMPEEDPGTFATIDEAKAWCAQRNAELVAAAALKPDEFDDAAIDNDSIETADHLKDRYLIRVARRGNGRWANDLSASFASYRVKRDWHGGFASSNEAIDNAADTITAWIDDTAAANQLGDAVKKQAQEIRTALARLGTPTPV